GRGGEIESGHHGAPRAGRLRGARDRGGAGHHRDGTERQARRKNRSPRGTQRGDGARDGPGAGADGGEDRQRLHPAEYPHAARDTLDEPPFEARAERGAEASYRERGDGGERVDGRLVEEADPRAEDEPDEHERQAGRQRGVEEQRRLESRQVGSRRD